MPPYLLASFTLLLLLWVLVVRAQNPSAVCTDGYEWMFNSDGESPCDVAAKLVASCRGTGYTIGALSPGESYWGPWKWPDALCMCSTVTWGLFSACAICQNATAISWDMWAYNCSRLAATRLPLTTPGQVGTPRWANLNIGEDGPWNGTAARADADEAPNHPQPRGEFPVVGIVLTALVTTVILCGWVVTCTSSWERRRAIEAVQDCLLRVWKTCHRKVIIPVQDCLTQIAERRARERAPQPRDVTTELSTAPGEFYP